MLNVWTFLPRIVLDKAGSVSSDRFLKYGMNSKQVSNVW